jgi:predicted RNase H-like nuclease (RuvC/YqgF family)
VSQRKKVQVKTREVQALNECISERDAQIKTLTKEMDRSKESAHRLERELFVNKQLQNATKLRELEKLSDKSGEIEDLISRIKKDMTGIEERLADRIDRLPVEQAAAAAAVPAAADAASSTTKISVPSRLISAALMLTRFSCVR